MTLQTPGGEAQPLPVKECIAAVQEAIEVCAKATRGPWKLREPSDDNPDYCLVTDESEPWIIADMAGGRERVDDEWPEVLDAAFAVAARAGYAATLEFLLWEIEEHQTEHIYPRQRAYPAVASIVAWHRAQGGRG